MQFVAGHLGRGPIEQLLHLAPLDVSSGVFGEGNLDRIGDRAERGPVVAPRVPPTIGGRWRLDGDGQSQPCGMQGIGQRADESAVSIPFIGRNPPIVYLHPSEAFFSAQLHDVGDVGLLNFGYRQHVGKQSPVDGRTGSPVAQGG